MSARDVITRFAQYAGQPPGRVPDGKNGRLRTRFPDGSGSSLYYRSDHEGRVVEIMSYGSHFPLARLALDGQGRRRLWVLNGNQWRGGGFGRTNQHNAMMREAAQKSGTPWIVLPFLALSSAGISPDSIVPVAAQPEHSWAAESVFRATCVRYEDHGYIARTRYFLSARDERYFLAELPASCRPQTVALAREGLTPATVRSAQAAGLAVLRQGSVLAIPAPWPTRALAGPSQRRDRVLGTSHCATEVRIDHDQVFARGFLRHARYRALRLGDGKAWYWLLPGCRRWGADGSAD